MRRQYGTNPESLVAEDHTYGQALLTALKFTKHVQTTLVQAVIEDFQNAESILE